MELAQSENISMTSAKPRWRVRFSLGTLILTALAVGTTAASIIVHRENVRLRTENRDLSERVRAMRIAAGELAVDDPRKVYLRTMETMGSRMWRWRVYIPENRSICCRLRYGDMEIINGTFGPGEHVLKLAIIEDANKILRVHYDCWAIGGEFKLPSGGLEFTDASAIRIRGDQQVGTDLTEPLIVFDGDLKKANPAAERMLLLLESALLEQLPKPQFDPERANNGQ